MPSGMAILDGRNLILYLFEYFDEIGRYHILLLWFG